MSYLYQSNNDPQAGFTQLEIQLDTGDTALLTLGHYYDLSASELARARPYITLVSSSGAPEEPVGVVRLPIKGNPTNDQIPQWSTSEGAFVPSTVSGVSGGPYASAASLATAQSQLDSVERKVPEDADLDDGAAFVWSADDDKLVAAHRPFRTVADPPYRADATGATLTTTELQSAVGAGAGTVYVNDGAYRFNSTLIGGSDTHVVVAAGATLQFEGPDTDAAFEFLGTEAAPISLTANATAGATSCSVAAGAEAGVTATNLVRVGSSATMGSDAIPIGEIAQVDSTSSGTVTFRSPLQLQSGAYNTADSAFISKITPAKNVSVTGDGTIKGQVGVKHYGVRVDRGQDVTITGVHFDTIQWIAVQLTDVIDATIDDITVNRCDLDVGYGVSIVNACQGVVVTNSHFRRTRHPTSINALTSRSGIPRHITVSHCTSWDNITSPVADAFDSHAAAEFINYLFNTCYDATNSAFNIECPIATVIGNTVHTAAKYGIAMINRTDTPTDWSVRGNRVNRTTGTGIRCLSHAVSSSYGSVIKKIDLADNTVNSPTTEGFRIESSSGTWDFKRVRLQGNTVNAPGSHAYYTVGLSASSISHNNAYDMPAGLSGIRCDNGTVTTSTTKVKLISNHVHYATAATVAAYRLTSGTSCIFSDNTVEGATGTGGIGLSIVAGSGCIVHGNDMSDATTTFSLNAASHQCYGNTGGVIRQISSAATITLGASENDVYRISGTNTIDTITATGMAGRRVVLYFLGAAGLSDGVGNLKLTGAFTGTADDAVTLFCDGTSWYEQARAAN